MHALAYVYKYHKVKEIEERKAGKDKNLGNPELHFLI